MKKQEAVTHVAEALRNERFSKVRTLTMFDGPTVILAEFFGTTLSVTVEILDQS